ncbi:Tim44 domain-containing protein [Chitinimonas taiwanensis]|jgi:predicted lipid-binding transport protein (Tim44 family)|uniref:Tim44 domain-containing protein n=1 Tax=Chitinimonas taiwanensis TaxID=240412 RepID=UPI0016132B9B
MKQILFAVFAVFFSLSFMVSEAEAKRFGGGKSSGMQRSAPQRDVTPQRPTQGQQAAPATPKRNWLGPIAGLAAGLGLAALFSHLGMGEGFANFMMIALLAVVAFAVIAFIMRRMKPAAPRAQYAGGPAQQPMQYQGQQPYGAVNEAPAFSGGSSAPVAPQFPADFDREAFVRVAKLNFVRLQAAYDSADLDDIREFTSPEMFAEIKLQIGERQGAANQTDVVQVDAEVVDYAQEGRRDIASVRFTGLVREAAEASAERFDETWHLSRNNDGRSGWVVAGIQQNG